MKVSLSWLKEYIKVDIEPEVLCERLTMAGIEVESIEKRYTYLNDIVAAKVNEVKKHPNADKLFICEVDAGSDKLLQIVCGAPNVKQGMYVPCALPGIVLPDGKKIKKGRIRGQISEGMLCSGAELKLNDDAAGIMDLKGDLIDAGTSVKKV